MSDGLCSVKTGDSLRAFRYLVKEKAINSGLYILDLNCSVQMH